MLNDAIKEKAVLLLLMKAKKQEALSQETSKVITVYVTCQTWRQVTNSHRHESTWTHCQCCKTSKTNLIFQMLKSKTQPKCWMTCYFNCFMLDHLICTDVGYRTTAVSQTIRRNPSLWPTLLISEVHYILNLWTFFTLQKSFISKD